MQNTHYTLKEVDYQQYIIEKLNIREVDHYKIIRYCHYLSINHLLLASVSDEKSQVSIKPHT